jgi:hypothetical protein
MKMAGCHLAERERRDFYSVKRKDIEVSLKGKLKDYISVTMGSW